MAPAVTPTNRRALAGSGRPLSVRVVTGLAAALLCSTCHWVDPECLSWGSEIDRQKAHPLDGTVHGFLRLTWQLRTGLYRLSLDGFGRWHYDEDAVETCQDLGPEKFRTLAGLWTGPDFDAAEPLCGPGYAYLPPGYKVRGREGECAEAWGGVIRRQHAYLPHVEMRFWPEGTRVLDGEPLRFFWDQESRLPEALDEAAAGMFGLLCEESRKLSRVLRRGHPELAAWAGCVKDDG